MGETEREFPMQDGPPLPWHVAEEIYRVYSDLYGSDQSLERLAERGGFAWEEISHMTKVYKRRRRGTGRLPWRKALPSPRRGATL